MFDIEKTYKFVDDTFNIRLKELSKTERVEFLSLGLKYNYLNSPNQYFVVKVKSKAMGTDIVVSPEEVVPMLEDSIEKLVLIEMYEHCQVLKDIKDTFNTYYSNDN
jgi:hypothetical protein